MVQTMLVIETGEVFAQCLHGLSPAVECLNNPSTCPCGYAEGKDIAHYPVPAIPYKVVFGNHYDWPEYALYDTRYGINLLITIWN